MARADIADQYEAIVIGAGIGGLFAANFLARAGVHTLLLERHDVVGGYLQGGWRKGFFFDYGTQSNEIRGAILPALEALGLEGRVKFHQCLHRFAASEGLDFTLHTLDDAELAFRAAYPETGEGLRRYFEHYREVTEVARRVNLDGIGGMIRTDCAEFMPDYHAYWRRQSYYPEMMEHDSIHAWRKAREFLGGQSRVGRVLSHFGYRNQSALATGIFWHLWRDDYFYNEGGKQVFMDMLAEAFVERGGTLALEAAAEEIVIEGRAVNGVRLANGQLIRARAVICNADLRFALTHLLNGQPAFAEWVQTAQQTPTSEAFFTVFLGTSIPVEELREALHGAHHTWFFPTHHGTPDPFAIDFHAGVPLEISAPVLHDPSLAEQGSHVVLQAFTYFDWMSRWQVRASGETGRDYRRLKVAVEEQLIDNACRIIPGLRERIVARWSATPLTHRRYTGNAAGASAGWTWNPRRTMVRLTEQRITTPIDNLYFAGHWVLYPGGLLTATLAGKIASDLVLADKACDFARSAAGFSSTQQRGALIHG
jgi:phytoene dehydrogenase-like protein